MESKRSHNGPLSAAGFMLGMARNPIDRMRRMGLEAPSARLFSMGFPLSRPRQLLYLTGADQVRPVFNDPATFATENVPIRVAGNGSQLRLRRGLIGSRGAEHKHYRASFIAQTGRAMMTEFAAAVAVHADNFLGCLPADAPIDLVAAINELVRHYAVVTMFKDDNPDFAMQIGREITAWIELGYNPANVLLPINIKGMPHFAFRRNAETLEAKILTWSEARRGMDAKRDLLSMFVNGPDEIGEPLHPHRLTGQILTLYAASFSSSVAALIWTLFLLMQHPDIAYDLCDELDGSGIDPLADGMKLLDLPLLDHVLKEGMRLFTPVPYQVRGVKNDAQPNGTRLRKKDIVVIGSWATNRLASIYPDAERFVPGRWETADANSYNYLTFSAGPRRCVGYGLAMIMVKITLASILLKRRPSLVPGTSIDTQVAVTLRSRAPIPVVMAPRGAKITRASIGGNAATLYAE